MRFMRSRKVFIQHCFHLQKAVFFGGQGISEAMVWDGIMNGNFKERGENGKGKGRECKSAL